MPKKQPHEPTPNAARFKAAVRRRFDWAICQGYNCRPISGSSRWSQHAEHNAEDVMDREKPVGITRAHGDELVAWLNETVETTGGRMLRRDAYGIAVVLWQVAAHYDHVHVDFRPHRYSLPQCKGGVALNWTLSPTVRITSDDDDHQEDDVRIREGASGRLIRGIKVEFNEWAETLGKNVPGVRPVDTDNDDYGPAMADLVERYQRWQGLLDQPGIEGIVAGELDGLTWASLIRIR